MYLNCSSTRATNICDIVYVLLFFLTERLAILKNKWIDKSEVTAAVYDMYSGVKSVLHNHF